MSEATLPSAVLDHLSSGADVVVPIGNGEPATVLDAIEDAGRQGRLADVRIHQMLAVRDRPSLRGEVPGVGHVSWFLSDVTRGAFAAGHIDLVPNHFSEVPLLLRQAVKPDLVVAAASPPDEDGWCTLGVAADYVASLIGEVPFFLEANERMPRTAGRHRLHVSELAGWCRADYELVELASKPPGPIEQAIADQITERIPNGATIQAGIGGIPNAVLASLTERSDLTIHTEMFGDGFVDLMESGAVSHRSSLVPDTAVATFALGSRHLYEWLDGRTDVEFHPVAWVNDPRTVGSIPKFVAINATTEVDLYGQCASETVAGRYYSSSGGQTDFARGAMYSPGGQGFMVMPATARGGTVSRIRVSLTSRSVVTTLKNTVDVLVTEYGVAELRGCPLRRRARALIKIAHPDFREDLYREAEAAGLL